MSAGLTPMHDEIDFSLYAWVPALKGTVSIGSISVPLDGDLGDTLSDLKGVIFGHIEVQPGPWIFYIDAMYADLGTDVGLPLGGNGRAALDRLQQSVPELILLDLMMPVMDGFEFLVELRKVDAWRSIPVIVVTAKDLTDHDRRQLSGSVATVLQKGAYERDELMAQVRELVTNCSRGEAANG